MNTLRSGVAGALLISGCIFAGGAAANAQLTDTDKAFLDTVAAGDVAAVELSRAALPHLRTPAVNGLAQTVTSDHNENYQALMDLCRQKQYAVAPQLDAYHADLLRKIQATASSDAVERIYVDAVTADQSALNSLLEQTAGNSNDTEIARFASSLLAMVKSHEAAAEHLASSSQQ